MTTLTLNSKLAKAADEVSSRIAESGKYIGVITRAESLNSSKGTLGLGLSFRTDSGQTVDYLDLYHTKHDGTVLSALKTVNAIMCCTKQQELKEASITVEKWNAERQAREKVTVPGYPDLMGKRVGFLLRKTLETDDKGKDRERMEIFGVFNADTELTATEMYDRKTKPERLTLMLDALMARPVIDKRKGGGKAKSGGAADDGYPDDMGAPGGDCPF